MLLYFDNFSDVHYMFNQDAFVKSVEHCEIPKVILYAVLALGIRFARTLQKMTLITVFNI